MNKCKLALKKLLYRLKNVQKLIDNIRTYLSKKGADNFGRLRYPISAKGKKNH